MFHHAIEMLIKGYLVRSHTPYELRNVGHRLSNLWSMFKLATGDAKLTRYDKTISDLDRVELLRYPDAMVDEGFILKVRLGVPASEEIPSTSVEPQYFVNVSDLDDIALAIFNVCNVNPKACFKNTPTELMRTLPQNFRLWE